MKKLFLLGLMLAFANSTVEANQALSMKKSEASSLQQKGDTCQPTCPRGPKGHKGPKGSKGSRGKRGRQGESLEINDYLQATTKRNGIAEIGFLTFDPIDYSSTGISSFVSHGMKLIESVPGSNNFDTITLPKEDKDTIYSVTFGISCGTPDSEFDPEGGTFVLVLNGNILNYTSLGINYNGLNRMISRTVIVRNPANTRGTLSVFAADSTTLGTASEIGFTSYITIVKLNQNGH